MSLKQSQGFYQLSIDQVFKAAEACGFNPTGEYFQLNSYENRVYDLFLESENEKPDHVIVKVYRSHRWSLEAIHEEHEFLWDLKNDGLQAVAPIRLKGESTTYVADNMIFTFFPKAIGRMPQELSIKDYTDLG
ncbi:MAG: serine/threonine protein kinase, partial [Bdellovibrionales bacterium]|nr:serine/threonine protein kinase [Bdellovibrionales bacterium]